MTEQIDARGLSCPQPMILVRGALQKTDGDEVTVLVDTMTQVHNCSRAAERLGWRADCQEKDDVYEIKLTK